MKISLSNQEEGHTILCLARYVGGVGTKSKIFFVMQFYDEVFARTVLNLTLKRQFKVEEIRKFQENVRNCILNKWNSMIFLFWKHEKYEKFKIVLINIPCRWNSNFQWKAYMELSAWRVFNFYFGPKVKVTHQNWGSRSSRSHFSILGLKNWENSNAEKIE